MSQDPRKWSSRTIVLWALSLLATFSLTGYVVLGAVHSTVSGDPLAALASACVGSLVTYLTTWVSKEETSDEDHSHDYEILLGNAVTRSIINDAMRKMGEPLGPVDSPPPPNQGGTS
jgi:hypothetical protein